MILESELSIVAKVNKTHGIDGEMSVLFFDADVADVVDIDTCVFFKIDGILVPFFVDGVRPRSTEALLLHLDGQDSQPAAAFFVGRSMYMRNSDLPEPDHDQDEGLYAAQLLGFRAFTHAGGEIGEITDIDDNTDNPLFVITPAEGKTIYVPIVDEFITHIDTETKSIFFDLPEGLLDL